MKDQEKSIIIDVNKPAFVIGNGTSRKDFDLTTLIDHGTIYGCNALYREFSPDFLAVIDQGMIDEITESGYPKKRILLPVAWEILEPKELYPPGSGLPKNNAGCFAIMKAIEHGHKEIWLFGFDGFLVDDEKAMSNAYDGTANYGPETRASLEDTRRRLRYFIWIIQTNPDVKFNLVYNAGESVYCPNMDNIRVCSYEHICFGSESSESG